MRFRGMPLSLSVTKIKTEIADTEQELQRVNDKDQDFLKFVEFALNYVDDLNSKWWELTPESRERCKQLSLPGGYLCYKKQNC